MSGHNTGLLTRLRSGLKHAFSLEGPHGPLSQEDYELLRIVGRCIATRRMAAPAILFLGSLSPLNYVGSQALHFLHPFVSTLFSPDKYKRFAEIIERRDGISALIKEIEAATYEDALGGKR